MPRLRKITNASNLISTYDILLKVPHEENSNAILEIGCGKGQWLTQNAIKFPHNQYFGIECDATIILKLLRKLHRQSFIPNNLHIIHDDARNLLNWFNRLNEIYLHFPDPWPKERHAKRRLVHRSFIKIYDNLLAKNGQLILKTDQEKLYEFALEELKQFPNLIIKNKNIDKNNPDIKTEYETKFISLNKPIYKIVVIKK